MDEIDAALTVAAVAISLASLYFARRSWLQSNRPIVTAFINDRATGYNAAVFDLVVSNTGNRPATSVRLIIGTADIDTLVCDKTDATLRASIEQCFVDASAIPVLRNGEELETALGAFTPDEDNRPSGLAYGATVPIEVHYHDLEGRFYKSKMPLKVHARKGFGGSVWE